MEKEDEPPNHRNDSAALEIPDDLEGILLLPDESYGEIAVCNPATLDSHFIYRVRSRDDNRYGEKSCVKHQRLISPLQLGGSHREILTPEYGWEKDGIEDPRISKNGLYYIVYTAFNEDELDGGARIALATTEDFGNIRKRGIIGPQIRLEEAVSLVGRDSHYGDYFQRKLNAMREGNSLANPFVMDKDATIVYSPEGKPILLHRIARSIQATPFDSILDLKKGDFWRDCFRNLEKQTILYPGRKNSDAGWASEKLGLGGTPRVIGGRIIGHIHGVEKKEEKGLMEYTYKSTFAEFNPETYKIISIIRDPLLHPRPDFTLVEENGKYITRKFVNFATEIHQEGSSVYSISGLGDKGIGYRTTSLQWLFRNLSHPHNGIKNWNSEE